MYVVSNTEDFQCDCVEEFVQKLKICLQNENGNEIWCSIQKEEEFPCLAILSDKIGASVTYFSENNEEQFVSIGLEDGGGMEEFLGGQYQVERCQIISYEEAMACAVEFFKTQQRARNIKWEEL